MTYYSPIVLGIDFSAWTLYYSSQTWFHKN